MLDQSTVGSSGALAGDLAPLDEASRAEIFCGDPSCFRRLCRDPAYSRNFCCYCCECSYFGGASWAAHGPACCKKEKHTSR